jgi:hypothetical protein
LEERITVVMSTATKQQWEDDDPIAFVAKNECHRLMEAAVAKGIPRSVAVRQYYWCECFEFPRASNCPTGEDWEMVRNARVLPSRQWKAPRLPTGDAGKDKYSGKEIRIFRIFLSLYYDAYGAFNRVYYSIGGIYLTLGNMKYSDRQKTGNAFIWGLVPPDHELTDCLECLVPQIKQLQRGFKLTLHHPSTVHSGPRDEEVWVVGGLGVITGDLPSSNKMANVKNHGGIHPCRMCKISKTELDRLDYNIEYKKRVRHNELDNIKRIRELGAQNSKKEAQELSIRYLFLSSMHVACMRPCAA